jgi:hypothetical protein
MRVARNDPVYTIPEDFVGRFVGQFLDVGRYSNAQASPQRLSLASSAASDLSDQETQDPHSTSG